MADTDQGDDRREHRRNPIELKVEYKRLNAFFADYTRNISKGGTFIQTTKPLDVGTEFVFKLYVPDVDQPLEIRGRVKWIVPADDDSDDTPGMGIRFLYENAEERANIANIVEKLMVDSLGPLLYAKLMDAGRASDDGESGKPHS